MKDSDWERLLKQSLATEAKPEEKLNENIINQLRERDQMKFKYRKGLSVGLLASVLFLVLSISAYAAVQLFSAKQVAEHLGNDLLADAFENKDAIQINQSKASGHYHFTLHGLVSGSGLEEFSDSSEDIYPERTYAVVSITRQDGEPMPDTTDPDYGKEQFFISPLVKGLEPWKINIASMNGAYSEDVIDGIMYRIIECDQVEIFSDRVVYLAISSGTSFYSNEAFRYDESTGEIEAREDYPGSAVLFNLPLDPAKAVPDKAEAFSETQLDPPTSQDSGNNEHSFAEKPEFINWIKDLRAKIRNGESIGEIIFDSIKEVEYDDSGNMKYTYDGRIVSRSQNISLFEEGQIGFSDQLSISGDGKTFYGVLFHRDKNGVITGRIVELDDENIPAIAK